MEEEATRMGGLLDSWMSHLAIMLFGYATIFVPGYFIIQYLHKIGFHETAGKGVISRMIMSCVYGNERQLLTTAESATSSPSSGSSNTSTANRAGQLIFCIIGLQVSYLTWGVLQEKIMTKEYVDTSDPLNRSFFKESQFLVFVNRILAFMLSGGYLLVSRQPRHIAPLYKYSYCSFSNIMSSWCQYEALKYVTFPTQVLAKASKIIPVMIMGKFVSAKTYEYYEYFTALLISLGMVMFLMGSSSTDSGKYSSSTTVSGVVILIGYMSFDAFTSNWQGELFDQYKMAPIQMMCGVNFFSCLLTSTSLAQQGGFLPSIAFMIRFPVFMWDCLTLSICSATGQLFIFYTISVFGPVVFIIIMTVRQCLAILLSCLLYSHVLSAMGVLGISLVFFAVFLRIYCSYRLKQVQKRRLGTQDVVRT
uniref:Adenosine 3'-phospho 5'-phosphosulfate transporter 1 n=1 Tax=Hirondellea gigas TaxID=1518452 RepID=A0A2P2I7P1_9CRUS